MKVLFLNTTANWHYFYPPLFFSLARELNKLGIEAKVAGYRELTCFRNEKIKKNKTYLLKHWGINLSLESLLTPIFWNKYLYKYFINIEYVNLKNYIIKNKMDVVITPLNYKTLLKLKKLGIKIVLFSGDEIFYDEWFEFAKNCETILTVSEYGKKIYEDKGINAKIFRFFVDDEYFYPQNKNKIIDFVFIGRRIYDRENVFKDMIFPLINKYKNFHIFGFGFDDITCIVHRPLFWHEIPHILNISKISVNIHREFFKQTEGSVNLRTYETLACKTFLLTDYTPGIAKLFEDKKEVVIARNGKEMLELGEYYLNNKEERERIAQRGY